LELTDRLRGTGWSHLIAVGNAGVGLAMSTAHRS
jgi:hypothetical protein